VVYSRIFKIMVKHNFWWETGVSGYRGCPASGVWPVLFITKGSASYRNASNLFLDHLISLCLLPLYDDQIMRLLPFSVADLICPMGDVTVT
jgi:hypothetical protein